MIIRCPRCGAPVEQGLLTSSRCGAPSGDIAPADERRALVAREMP